MSSVPEAALAANPPQHPQSVVLVSYPKIVFLYPSLIVGLIAAVATSFMKAGGQGAITLGWVFLIVLTANLIVLSFDFPRGTSLTLFFVGVAVVLAGALLSVYVPDFVPAVGRQIAKVRPEANASFYWIYCIMLALIYVGVLINRKFDYWEVRPNELLHHHGFLSDLERFSAPNLRIDKEINDVFEYALLQSGRLILHPSNERRAIVLENVFRISQKEQQITKMLGALQVELRTEPDENA